MDVTEIRNIAVIVSTNNEVPQNCIQQISNCGEYSDIFEDYISKNIPFTLPIADNTWKCFSEWLVDEKPNFDYLKHKFGQASVPVANCSAKYFNAQEKETMLLKDFLDYWKEYVDRQYPNNMKCLYLKDWHFTRDYPDENIYIVPKYFSSDWLNEYLTSTDNSDVAKDDYRFVYMGPKGTWTPFHADVFSSFSWSANICGKKKWVLFPPGEEKCLKDKFGNLVYDINSDALRDQTLFPDYSDTIRCYELIQGPGEAVFVPSGWHHQVWNLDDTISINHNWVNGCNVTTMWKSLQQNLYSVKKEIADCQSMDGWVNHCQIMLKASFGIDYLEFYKFIQFISYRRINLLNNNEQIVVYGGWRLGPRHAAFDLIKIKNILCDIILNEDVKLLDSFKENLISLTSLMCKINSVVPIS